MDRARWITLAKQATALSAVLIAGVGLWAQAPAGGQGKGGGGAAKGAAKGPPATPKSQAPMDLTGYWVSLVTEDWLYRMVTPDKPSAGKQADVSSIPVSPAGRAAAQNWDPAKDNAADCKAYGPPGLTRLPSRLHIDWADDNTLKMDVDAGTQTRLLKFGTATPGAPSRMGTSVASWEGMARGGRGGAPAFGIPPGATGDPNAPAGRAAPVVIRPGSLRVITTNMTPGYLRKNGVPYSAQTVLSEWYDIIHEPNGDEYLIISSVVDDPINLTGPWRTSTHFKKEADGSKFSPSACTVK